MKLVKEHINEKFAQDSDPIKDLGIGNPEKSIFPILIKELKNIGIHAEVQEDESWDGFWWIIIEDVYDDNICVDIQYATDEASKKYNESEGIDSDDEINKGGFVIHDEKGETLLKPTYDYQKVVALLAKIKYGDKKEINFKIQNLQKQLDSLKSIRDLL